MNNETNIPSVLLVASSFLKKAKEFGITMTPLKLMKLTYIAHGVKLAVTGDALFKENVEAWRYGPVINELYQEIKTYGSNVIDSNALEPCCNGEELSSDDIAVVDAVLHKWGDKTGPALSTLTHQVDTPWYKVWRIDGGILTGSDIIPKNLIKDHYIELLGIDSGE